MVEAELKTEVNEDMRAAIITANIIPRRPIIIIRFTSRIPDKNWSNMLL
jgi:hypothetical protein